MYNFNGVDYEGEFKNDLYDGKRILKTYSKMTETQKMCIQVTSNPLKYNNLSQVEFTFKGKSRIILEVNELTEFETRMTLNIPVFQEKQQVRLNQKIKFSDNTFYSIDLKKIDTSMRIRLFKSHIAKLKNMKKLPQLRYRMIHFHLI